MKITLRLFSIFLCGYLMIEWFPIYHPFNFEDIFVRPIINPLEFFAATVAFCVGLIVSAGLFKEIIQLMLKAFKKQIPWSYSIILGFIGLIVTYFFLFQVGWEQTIVLFGFSFLYGMISVEH